eukprot:1142851-Pelagomonas_calceolata.AAC.4
MRVTAIMVWKARWQGVWRRATTSQQVCGERPLRPAWWKAWREATECMARGKRVATTSADLGVTSPNA